MLLRVDRRWREADSWKQETRYYLTSLAPEQTTPAQLMHHVRGHWQVENSLHFVKDRWWDEDRHYTRRPGVAEWLAMLTNLALTVLYRYQRQVPGYPVRACADRIAWNPLVGLKLLGLAN